MGISQESGVNTGQLSGERWEGGRKKGKRALCTSKAKRFRRQRLPNEPTATITVWHSNITTKVHPALQVLLYSLSTVFPGPIPATPECFALLTPIAKSQEPVLTFNLPFV
jgi:hypothetical protein